MNICEHDWELFPRSPGKGLRCRKCDEGHGRYPSYTQNRCKHNWERWNNHIDNLFCFQCGAEKPLSPVTPELVSLAIEIIKHAPPELVTRRGSYSKGKSHVNIKELAFALNVGYAKLRKEILNSQLHEPTPKDVETFISWYLNPDSIPEDAKETLDTLGMEAVVTKVLRVSYKKLMSIVRNKSKKLHVLGKDFENTPEGFYYTEMSGCIIDKHPDRNP